MGAWRGAREVALEARRRGGEGVVGGVDFEDLGRGDGVAAADELEAFELVEGAVVGAFPAGAVAGEAFEDEAVALEVVLEGVAEVSRWSQLV